MPRNTEHRDASDWLLPSGEQGGLSHYVQVLRERLWIVIAAILLTLAGAIVYLATSDKVYEGEARLLITPAPEDDALLASLGVPRATNDPTRDVETVAILVTSLDIAERAREVLDTDESAQSLQDRVDAEPIASSNLVSIKAQAPTADAAAELANAFAVALIEDRTRTLHEEIDELLPSLREKLGSSTTGITPEGTLRSDITRLEVLREAPDPTIRLETRATPPSSPISPRPALTLIGAVLVGLVIGIGAAFAAQTLDPRLRREDQLRSRYRLPILARIPREPSRKNVPLGPAALAMPTREAYRTLRANVIAARENPNTPYSVMVTGSSPSEGKTTSAINLAGSLALAGNRTILIEADLRRPAIAKALGLEVETGVVSTILGNVSMEDALMTTPAFGPSLQLLLADYKGAWMSELFSLHAAQRLLAAAKSLAEFVIVDSPPLTTVIDTLPLAQQVDEVIIITKLGETRLDRLPELAELLAGNDIRPLGFALIGTQQSEGYYYYEDDEGDHVPGDVIPAQQGSNSEDPEPEPARAPRR